MDSFSTFLNTNEREKSKKSSKIMSSKNVCEERIYKHTYTHYTNETMWNCHFDGMQHKQGTLMAAHSTGQTTCRLTICIFYGASKRDADRDCEHRQQEQQQQIVRQKMWMLLVHVRINIYIFNSSTAKSDSVETANRAKKCIPRISFSWKIRFSMNKFAFAWSMPATKAVWK